MQSGTTISLESVYMHQPNQQAGKGAILDAPGQLKLSEGGLGWRDSRSGKITTLAAADVSRALALRCMRRMQLRLHKTDSSIFIFDNIDEETLPSVEDLLRESWGVALETRQTLVKGANWGITEIVEGGRLAFSSKNSIIFDIPLSEVINATNPGKDEVAIEFSDGATRDADCVVEMRFFVPNQANLSGDPASASTEDIEMAGSDNEGSEKDDEEQDDDGKEGGKKSGAKLLCERIQSFSQVNRGVGRVIATLPSEITCIQPRGRLAIDMSATHLRLKGKSYDHRIPYAAIAKIFLLPRIDETHVMLILQVDPPLRQGQTRYPFVTLQMGRDEECRVVPDNGNLQPTGDDSSATTSLNVSKEMQELKSEYSGATYEVLASLLRDIAGQRPIVPGTSFQGAANYSVPAVKAIYKANDGYLYFLERSLIFLPKSVILIPHSEVSYVEVSRIGSGSGNPRSFDIRIQLRRPLQPGSASIALGSNAQDIALSNIPKEEYPAIEAYLRLKGIDCHRKESESTGAPGQRSRGVNATSQAAEDLSSTDEEYDEDDSEFGSGGSSSDQSGNDDETDQDSDDEEEDEDEEESEEDE